MKAIINADIFPKDLKSCLGLLGLVSLAGVFVGFFFIEKPEHRILYYFFVALSLAVFGKTVLENAKLFFKENKLFSLFLIYAFFVSIIQSLNQWEDVWNTFRLIILPLLFVFILPVYLNSQKKWENILVAFIIGGLAVGLYALFDYFIIDGKNFMLPSNRYKGIGRMDNANIAGFLYSTAWIIFWTKKQAVQDLWQEYLPKFSKFLMYIIPLVFLLMVMASQSRNAVLASVVATGFLLLYNKQYKVIFGLSLAVISVVGVVIWQYGDFSDFLSRGNNFRFGIWQDSYSVWQENFIFGTGYQREIVAKFAGYTWSSPHNLYLGIGCYLGIVGLLFFIAAWSKMIFKNIQALKISKDQTFVTLIVFGLVFSLFETHTIFLNLSYEWFFFWLPISYTLYLDGQKRMPSK